MSGPDERIWVVPRAWLFPAGTSWRGIRRDGLDAALETIRTRCELRPRAAMEADPTFKQVIPYLVLRDGPRYFLMRRTRAGLDARLHERYSIGVGGHLNDGDADLEAGLRREWREEIEADFVPEFRLIGLLNDDHTDVGRVHFGLVYEAETDGLPVAVCEVEKLSGRMAEPHEVAAVREHLESWSEIAFDELERVGSAR